MSQEEHTNSIQQACELLRQVSELLSPGSAGQNVHVAGRPADPNSGNGTMNDVIAPSVCASDSPVRSSFVASIGGPFQSASRSLASGSSVGSRTAEEMRRLFESYDPNRRRLSIAPPGAVGRRSNQRSSVPRMGVSAERSASRNTAEIVWQHRFFCLGGPDDLVTPTTAIKYLYGSQQIGEKVVTSVNNGTSFRLKSDIIVSYPQLSQCNFELLRAEGNGGGRRLLPILDAEEIPSVPEIRRLRVVGIIYVRPHLQIFHEDVDIVSTEPAPVPQEMDIQATFLENEELVQQIVLNENVVSPRTSSLYETIQSQAGGFRFDPNLNAGRPATSVIGYLGGGMVPSDESVGRPSNGNEVVGTHQEFQAQIYLENEGSQTIFVSRDDFLDQVLGLYMKDESLDIKKKPLVMFAGEAGRDVGGLTREYFSLSLTELCSGKYRGRFCIFEGEDDHKLPAQDALLLRSGVFKAVGKLMAHSFIHTGVAAFGLSLAAAEYICYDKCDSETRINMQYEDICSTDARDVLSILDNWDENTILQDVQQAKLTEQAAAVGFNAPLSFSNRHLLKEIMITYHVIDCRKSQLEDIKQAFRTSGIVNFMTNRHHLIAATFPRQCGTLTAVVVFSRIDFEGQEAATLREYFQEFLDLIDEETGVNGIRKLLVAWTAWPELMDEKLIVSSGGFEFFIHTCFSKIEIPVGMTKSEIFNLLRVSMDHGGFGGI